MKDPTFPKILDMIQSAVDLANSVRDDAKGKGRKVSDKSILLAGQFRDKHKALDQVLELMASTTTDGETIQ